MMELRALPISSTSDGGGALTMCTGPLLIAPGTEKGVASDVSVWRDERKERRREITMILRFCMNNYEL